MSIVDFVENAVFYPKSTSLLTIFVSSIFCPNGMIRTSNYFQYKLPFIVCTQLQRWHPTLLPSSVAPIVPDFLSRKYGFLNFHTGVRRQRFRSSRVVIVVASSKTVGNRREQHGSRHGRRDLVSGTMRGRLADRRQTTAASSVLFPAEARQALVAATYVDHGNVSFVY